MKDLAQEIKAHALQLGYEKCGIVKITDTLDFADVLRKRVLGTFMGPVAYADFKGFKDPRKQFPWAKSIVVLVSSYAKYNLPEGFDGMYGKAYVFDGRVNEVSSQWQMCRDFRVFLEGEGLKCQDEPKFGIVGMRWAAHKAGLGIIRHNNFFYTEDSGSYCSLEAWLIDAELEVKEETDLKPCPDNCNLCIKACPTNSLKAPYKMSLLDCASFKTTLSPSKGLGNINIKTAAKMGRIVYGCDICQDVCPHNKDKHIGGEDFPEFDELAQYMSPEKIMSLSYDEIGAVLSKYWYISPNHLWKWKLNALTFMLNNYNEGYEEYINLGLKDTDKRVRAFAKKVAGRVAR
jgi:epoxyqueuosine reductase